MTAKEENKQLFFGKDTEKPEAFEPEAFTVPHSNILTGSCRKMSKFIAEKLTSNSGEEFVKTYFVNAVEVQAPDKVKLFS